MRISKAGYEAIAKALAGALPPKPSSAQRDQHRECCLRLVYMFGDNMPRFNAKKFMDAAGAQLK